MDLTIAVRKYEIPKRMKLTDWRFERYKARQVGNPQNMKVRLDIILSLAINIKIPKTCRLVFRQLILVKICT